MYSSELCMFVPKRSLDGQTEPGCTNDREAFVKSVSGYNIMPNVKINRLARREAEVYLQIQTQEAVNLVMHGLLLAT